MYKYFVIFSAIIALCYSDYVNPGPWFRATKGAVWPHPRDQKVTHNFYAIIPETFIFETHGFNCDILKNAIARYKEILLTQIKTAQKFVTGDDRVWWDVTPGDQGHLARIKIYLNKKCEKLPYLDMDESYSLVVSNKEAILKAESVWGILRGLESFSQLIYPSSDMEFLMINETTIHDSPRFRHRGLLVDTSRHFIKIPTLEKILDGMSYNKLNVFHWHIVDDNSFPYQSKKYPDLSKGAYHPSMIYSQKDVAHIIEYARLRGIRVMAEFDTPGHTASWGVGHPEILSKCYRHLKDKSGPIDIISDKSLNFMYGLLEEIVEVFPDEYVHLGGDEVDYSCWASDDKYKNYMNDFNIHKHAKLQGAYIKKLTAKLESLKAKPVVWQEMFTQGVQLPARTVVQTWLGEPMPLLQKIVNQGYYALLSTCWYLDQFRDKGDWIRLYECEPLNFIATEEQKNLVLGGEACMWSEYVNEASIIQKIFPRVSATAEKLWSQKDIMSVEKAALRLEEHYCRMRYRNISAQPPNGPGFCLV